MALERIAYDIQGKNIDILTVQFGMNDANVWQTDKGNPRVSLRGFEANRQEIIDRVYSFGVRQVILNTNHAAGRIDILPNTDITYLDNERRYNEAIRRVAADNPGRVVLGDRIYYERFYPILKDVVDGLAG